MVRAAHRSASRSNHHVRPAVADENLSTVTAPKPLEDFLSWKILAEARKKESDAATPEVAAVFDELSALVEDVSKNYLGFAL